MRIAGFQKLTLLDFPNRVACIIFTQGCNYKCPYCHNSELLDINAPALMDVTEFFRFLERRQGLLDGVAITGGEPLLRKDIVEFIKRIREMGFLVKLDTNGNHPDKLGEILDSGLVEYVAMDVKNSKERYGETIGLPQFDIRRVDESIQILLSGKVEYEFRTTVVKEFHDAASFEGIAEWIKGADNYYLQGFVDRETVMYSGLGAYSKEEMETFQDIVKPHVKHIEIRGL